MKMISLNGLLIAVLFCLTACNPKKTLTPVDYVNPYMGNISHMLVPTYPTVHLPNSMLRMVPLRGDYATNKLTGLPVFLAGHRTFQVFTLSPFQGDAAFSRGYIHYEYDRETVKPYFYSVYLDNEEIEIKYAPSHQSAMYEMNFLSNESPSLILQTQNGTVKVNGNTITGSQKLANTPTTVYLYMETDLVPVSTASYVNGSKSDGDTSVDGRNAYVRLDFASENRLLKVRYGISYISEEQAKQNLYREIKDYDLDKLALKGREIWNEELGKIKVEGNSEQDKAVFYTSLYRVYERMICLSEDGRYYSGFDNKVHDDEGIPFYTDDWIWDTYRAAHPLRTIIDPQRQVYMLNSFVRMAEQRNNFWLPTFAEVIGDTYRMNSNHGVATILDCYNKGLTGFDLEKAYLAGKNAITEKTLAPWSEQKAGVLDQFYKDYGYFPALSKGEEETVPEVHSWERRQPVAVTLGTVYDEWCLSQLAKELGKTDEYNYFKDRSFNFKKVFNPETKFFHPKDKDGNFIEPFDYGFSEVMGARDAYDENNGWIYRWDVQHNIAELVALMGGKEAFVRELERMYDTSIGRAKYTFYAILPDHTGNVGQFSMANEPCLHIPYLYNYAGQPWRTQKRVRTLIDQWFRNDLMGVPGDEDGGGMSAFVVFSQLGFYPVTPGLPMYVIGSPFFEKATVQIGNGKQFTVKCVNYGKDNKYIQSAKLNGKELNRSWFSHEELMQGGILELKMGAYPNKQWASADEALPPSFEMN